MSATHNLILLFPHYRVSISDSLTA